MRRPSGKKSSFVKPQCNRAGLLDEFKQIRTACRFWKDSVAINATTILCLISCDERSEKNDRRAVQRPIPRFEVAQASYPLELRTGADASSRTCNRKRTEGARFCRRKCFDYSRIVREFAKTRTECTLNSRAARRRARADFAVSTERRYSDSQ
jgi:hypothetical protein